MARTKRTARQRREGRSPFIVGLIFIAIIAVGVFLGFTKHIPFTGGFELRATFQSANALKPNSPVRIAGVNIGKVKKIEGMPGSSAAVVVMELKKDALPIHKDATAKIRPRIFLEGNFFVDIDPGTPSAPVLSSGDTLKITQTAAPVQLDEVLTSLQTDTRQELQQTLDAVGSALTDKPTALQDSQSDPSVQGKSGAQALNAATRNAAPALRDTSIVNQAFLGDEPDRDLARLITGLGRTTGGLIANEGALKDLITNFNTTMAAFASEASNLRATIRDLSPTLKQADTTLADLNASFPPTRALARELIPGVKETPATIAAGFPWIAQTRKLLSEQELRGVTRALAPTTKDLAGTTNDQIKLLPQIDAISRCALNVILPTGDVVINDEFKTGQPNYKEFAYGLVGLAGEGQNVDGNGMYVRFQVGGGDQTVSLGSATSALGQLFGNSTELPVGTRPAYPGKRPPYRPDVPCYTNKPPDLNGYAARKGPGETSVSASSNARRDTSKRSDKADKSGAAKPEATATQAPAQTPQAASPTASATATPSIGGVVGNLLNGVVGPDGLLNKNDKGKGDGIAKTLNDVLRRNGGTQK